MAIVLSSDFNGHVLVSGSRKYNAAMRTFVYEIVERIHANGWTLIVGDAPGVDTAAVMHAITIGCPYLVYHIDVVRIHNIPTHNTVHCHGLSYTERDEAMVRDAGIVFCVWNGYSTGTKHVFDYASKWTPEHKLVYMKRF